MPRIERGPQDNFIYHVINRGNGRQEVFHKDKDYSAFVELLKEAKNRYPVNIFGYCLMPNHYHVVVKPAKGEELSRWMQWSSVAGQIQKLHDTGRCSPVNGIKIYRGQSGEGSIG